MGGRKNDGCGGPTFSWANWSLHMTFYSNLTENLTECHFRDVISTECQIGKKSFWRAKEGMGKFLSVK
jgi:hypothetical protein